MSHKHSHVHIMRWEKGDVGWGDNITLDISHYFIKSTPQGPQVKLIKEILFHTSRSPFPVDISTLIATANPIIAVRPSHTSKPLPSLLLCSHLTENDAALRTRAFC